MKRVAGSNGISDRAFLKSRQVVRVFSYAPPGDHEDAGILTNGGGFYTGVMASHVIYPPAKFNLAPPADARNDQTLYAPTTRPPNGSCIEVGTAYRKSPNSADVIATVYAFDFCTGGGQFAIEAIVDAQFLAQYGAGSIDGASAYATAIVADSVTISAGTKWRAYLFDYPKQRWELFYQTIGAWRSDLRGWSIFETWYEPGQCSASLPKISVRSLKYYNAADDTWAFVSATMHNSVVNYEHIGRDCFEDQASAMASYVFRRDSWSGWTVTSTGQ